MNVSLGTGISGHVAQTGKSIRVDDVQKDPRYYKKIDNEMGRSTGSYLCSPLTVQNRIIGTMQIMKSRNAKHLTKLTLSFWKVSLIKPLWPSKMRDRIS